MLGTRDRALFLESLRPPTGYRLRRAVGTSFTLDLMTLLTVPLAFTFFDAHDENGDPVADPVALLEALRRHAEKIALFCQAGAIGLPSPDQKLLAFVEGSVIESQSGRDGGIFHPKVWVLNFEADGKPAVYRVLCLSRNLTFARAWDTCLRLEGRLVQGQGDYPRNKPFADLLLELPELATRSVSNALRRDLGRMAHEIRRVDLRPPRPFTDFRVHNFGFEEGSGWPFPSRGRGLAVSPFLAGSTVRALVRDHGLEALVSRPEAFEDVVRNAGSDVLPKTCYVLSPGARLDSRDAEEEDEREQPDGPSAVEDQVELAGLHAKLFLFENGREARLFTGSANATGAAFRHNVEVLVELVGRTKDCGIDALLGSDADPRQETLRSLLQEYRPPDPMPPIDETRRALEALEWRVEQLARTFGAARLTATVADADAERRWDMTLSGALSEIPAGVEVRVWPATLSGEASVRLDGREEARDESARQSGSADQTATFRGLSFEALTGFFAFEAALREGGHEVRKRFVVTAEVIGAPEDRKDRVLRSLLKDRRRVLQLLLLILMGEDADVSAFVQAARRDGTAPHGSFGSWDQAALLEALLGSLSSNPGRIDDAARLISDLRRTSEGEALLPEGLSEIWEPVWEAREALQS